MHTSVHVVGKSFQLFHLLCLYLMQVTLMQVSWCRTRHACKLSIWCTMPLWLLPHSRCWVSQTRWPHGELFPRWNSKNKCISHCEIVCSCMIELMPVPGAKVETYHTVKTICSKLDSSKHIQNSIQWKERQPLQGKHFKYILNAVCMFDTLFFFLLINTFSTNLFYLVILMLEVVISVFVSRCSYSYRNMSKRKNCISSHDMFILFVCLFCKVESNLAKRKKKRWWNTVI